MEIKLIFVCAFLLALSKSQSKECSSTFAHQIFISNKTGHNNSTCLSQFNITCKTLDYVLEEMMNRTILRNSTKIEIEGYQILKENYNLTKLKDFALCGIGENKYAEIECKHGKGLVILSSQGIAIEHLLFRGCGSRKQTKDIGQYPFYSGIFLSNTVDVRINYCSISDSTGIGMTFFDVGGSVNFSNTIFRGNLGNLTNRIKFLSKSDLVPVGGGLIIEFTYSGGLPPFNSSNNQYNFSQCKFIQNNCSWKYTPMTQLDPKGQVGNTSSLFGSGGGMGINFKGSASNNLVVIEHCVFRDNTADWGGGYCFHFQDDSKNNTVLLSHVHVFNNSANYAGGGGRLEFFPNVKSSDLHVFPNYCKHTYCKFQNNYANWGGGISIFGTYELSENKKGINFSKCHWLRNRAVVGSALGLLSHWPNPGKQIRQPIGKGILYVKLFSCIFEENFIIVISNAREDDRNNVIGTGVIYSDIAMIIMQSVSFNSNNGTALVLDWSDVNIFKDVTFSNNSGSKGGAVALYGRSTIILGENAILNFTNNSAELRGGAVYAYSQGPDLKAFDVQILDRSICFFSYINPNTHPENWTARVYFQNNIAPPKSGKSIYTDTLQFCRNYGNVTEALEWKPTFNYNYDFMENNTDNHDVVTDPIMISTERVEWNVSLGELFYPKIFLYDEKNHSVNGLLKMQLHGVELQEQISHYVYVSNNKSATPLALETSKNSDHYDLTLSSVFTQIIRYKLENISITKCYGGYVFDSDNKKCVCLHRNKMPFGFSRCKGDGKTIYLKRGYWGTMSEKGFYVLPCPPGYCKCSTDKNTNEATDECVFVKFNNTIEQCANNRKGMLCGSCKDGLSVVVGKQDCRDCHTGNAKLGPLWLILILAGLTVVVLAIIYFELDFFSGPLNSWLYTYHIIYLLPYSESYLDPFINFVISLTNGTFDISSGKCIWNGMDALQKLTLEYVTPFYCLIFLYFFNKLLHYFPSLSFSNHSFHRALVTIVIILYASVLHSTMSILQPVIINDEYYVYVQADLKYFNKGHLPYAIPALLILILIVIPFPFIIVFNNFFVQNFRFMKNFIPLFQVLQSPYRPGRSWFASYYIFCRLFMVLVMIFSPFFQYSRVTVYESISVIILMIFVLLQPYTNENHFFFIVDTVFLSLLCLINSFTNAMQINQHAETVNFFCILIRIAIYIPLLYSVGLLMKHAYQSWNDYWQKHRADENTGLLQ